MSESLPMVCTCRVDGVREAEERRLRIFRRMGLKVMEDLTTAIVLSLAFDFQADADVGADMWFGVYVSSPVGGVSVECDAVEDGLAAAWEHLANRDPQRVSVCEGGSGHIRIVERLSAGVFAWYEVADRAYREHRAASHRDDNDCLPCEDCSVLLGLSIRAKIVLADVWGARVLDPAVQKAFD